MFFELFGIGEMVYIKTFDCIVAMNIARVSQVAD